MATLELVWGIVAAVGMVAAFAIEWRRGNLSARIQELESAQSPTNNELHARVYELEQWRDRYRRGV